MYGNGRKIIGVFICEINHFFQKSFCSSISEQAEKLGYNIAFFTFCPNHSSNRNFDDGEINLIKLPIYEELDGVIIASDTFSDNMLDCILSEIEKRCTCPVMSLRQKLDRYQEKDGFYNIIIDNDTAMEGIINHFIKDHGYKRICFLAGRQDHLEGVSRLNTFLRVMSKNNIPVDEDDIYYGDFWKYCGEKAVAQFLAPGKERPQVIICANDYMGLSVCQELSKLGILVPEEIAVSGFDNIRESMMSFPSLTTVDIPVSEMGRIAFDIIERKQKGEYVEKDLYINTKDLYRASCGCIQPDKKELSLNQTMLMTEIDDISHAERATKYFSIAIEAAKSASELSDILDVHLYLNKNFKNFFMCLCMENEELNEKVVPLKEGYSSKMWCSLALTNKTRTDNSVFDRSNLIPPEYVDDSPQIYYFAPLHYNLSSFGYVATNHYYYDVPNFSYQMIISHVSNSLESIHVKNKMNSLVNELEELYIRDSLTGLYNRRGFEQLSNQNFNKSIENNESMMVLVIDMDGLKYINDKFGHAHGDLAIQTIADALRHAGMKGEICARVGGDEFGVVGINYSIEMQEEFIKRFYEYLDLFNANSDKSYIVSASYGACITNNDDERRFQDYYNTSDFLMYKQKTHKKQHLSLEKKQNE